MHANYCWSSTWEPTECFLDANHILEAWTETQDRVQQGLQKAFDVSAWEDRRSEYEAKKRKCDAARLKGPDVDLIASALRRNSNRGMASYQVADWIKENDARYCSQYIGYTVSTTLSKYSKHGGGANTIFERKEGRWFLVTEKTQPNTHHQRGPKVMSQTSF